MSFVAQDLNYTEFTMRAKKFVFVSQFATVLYKNAPFYEVGQGIQKLQYTAIYHVLHSSKFKLLEMTKYQHKIRSSIHP